MTKCRGQVDEERNETLSHIGTWTGRVGNDLGKETLHTLHSQRRQDLGQTLGRSLSIDTASIGSKGAQELVDQVGETRLAETFDECSERLGSGGSCFGNRVDEDLVQQRHEFVEVRRQVSCFRQRGHVADNLDRFPLDLGTSLLQSTVDNGHDEREGRGIEIVLERCLEQCRQCLADVGGRVGERLHQSVLQCLDFGVAEHLAESLQRSIGSRLDLGVRVVDDSGQLRDDGRQRQRQLTRGTEGHCTVWSATDGPGWESKKY